MEERAANNKSESDGPSMDQAAVPVDMDSVISKLRRARKICMLADAKHDIEYIDMTLMHCQAWYCYLADASQDKLDEADRDSLSQIKELFSDTDKIMDICVGLARPPQQVSNIDLILWHIKHGYDISNHHGQMDVIKEIRQRAGCLIEVYNNYNLPSRLLDLYKDEKQAELVGIEGPTDAVIKMLAEGDDMSKKEMKTVTVSIVGLGGLGKTTLARAVFHQLKPQFDCAAFVSAHKYPDLMFLLKISCQLGLRYKPDDEVGKGQGLLTDRIREFLLNKRYLVVIDDLSNEGVWRKISCILPNNAHGSRVITTTRLNDIANLCCSGCDDWIYEIHHLGYQDSVKLFQKQFFRHELICPNTSTDIFYEIMKMCGGTPSEIISIASLIAAKISAAKPWQELMNSVYSAWKQTASSSVSENINPGFQDLTDIVLHNYVHLPRTLQVCLLYLAVHAKNQKIHRTTMVRKWIAGGFIPRDAMSTREKVASRYFDELIARNFIQLVEYGNCLGEEIYEVNYMRLYFLRLISQEGNFASIMSDVGISWEYAQAVWLSVEFSGSELPIHTEKMNPSLIFSITTVGPVKIFLKEQLVNLWILDLDGCKDLDNSAMAHICRMIELRYLSLRHTQVTEIPPEIRGLQYLQTLDIRQNEISNLPPEIGKLRYLETLDIRQTEISNLPPEIGKLQNLRTLDARFTRISCLPPEIRKLKNLETLDVRQTKVKELPKGIIQLPKLTHLYFGQGVKLLVGSEHLKSVKVLGIIDSREFLAIVMEEISALTEIRELEIALHDHPADKDRNDKLLSSIGKCMNLEYLIIYGDCNLGNGRTVSPNFPRLKHLKVIGRFVEVPQWIAQLTTLKKLDVRVCKLDQDDLKILGGLPGLSTLAVVLVCIPRKKQVVITSILHPEEEISPAGFNSLEVFSFNCRLPWVTFEEGAMPRLKHLHLKLYECPADKFPSGIINLRSLEKIILWYSSDYASSGSVTSAVASIRQEASIHDNLIELSVNGVYAFFPSRDMSEEASSHGNQQAGNTRADKRVIGTEIEEHAP